MLPSGFLYRRAKLARASAAVRRRRRGTGECSAGDTVSPRAVGDGTRRADQFCSIFTATATTIAGAVGLEAGDLLHADHTAV